MFNVTKMSKQITIALIMILTPVVCVFAGVESRIASSIALFLYVGGCYFLGDLSMRRWVVMPVLIGMVTVLHLALK